MWTDTHVHVDHEAYDADRAIIIQKAWDQGVRRLINVGFNRPTIYGTLALMEQYDWIDGVIGWHPLEVETLQPDDLTLIAAEVQKNSRIVAIGEIGLDYARSDAPRELQQKVFADQIQWARRLQVPIVVHNRDAHADTIRILEQHRAYDVGGVMHCFSGSWEVAEVCLQMGFALSFGGPITFKNAKTPKEVLARVPSDRWMIETDAPYLSPHPFRGKRNESMYIPLIGAEAAAIRGITVEQAATQSTGNAWRWLPRRSLVPESTITE